MKLDSSLQKSTKVTDATTILPMNTIMKSYIDFEKFTREKILKYFASNMCFAFVFGNVAHDDSSSLCAFNIFVCLHERMQANEHTFRTRLYEKQIMQ